VAAADSKHGHLLYQKARKTTAIFLQPLNMALSVYTDWCLQET